MNIVFKCVYIIAMIISVTAGTSASEVWNFAKQLSNTTNPNGPWSVEQAPDLTKQTSAVATQPGSLIQQIIQNAAIEKKK
jgi:hypothetical protein